MQCPLEWDPEAIDGEFAPMHQLGFNSMRLAKRWTALDE